MSNATHETVRVEDVGFAYRRFGRRGAFPPVSQLLRREHGRLGPKGDERLRDVIRFRWRWELRW